MGNSNIMFVIKFTGYVLVKYMGETARQDFPATYLDESIEKTIGLELYCEVHE